MVSLARYLRDLPPNEGGRSIKDHEIFHCGRRNATLIVFIEEHFIQSSIQSKNKAINVLPGEQYQGDPDLYWSFTFSSFNKVANL